MSKIKGKGGRARYNLAFPILCTIILAVLVNWTYARNEVWTDSIHLWVDTAKKSPHKARPFNNVASEFLMLKMVDQAIPWIEKAVYLTHTYPASQDNYQNLLAVYGNMGILLAEQHRYVEAVSLLSRGIKKAYYEWQGHNNIALYLAALGMYDHAIWELNEAIRINPNEALPRKNLERITGMKEKRGRKSP